MKAIGICEIYAGERIEKNFVWVAVYLPEKVRI
jgi:hypothetical protein